MLKEGKFGIAEAVWLTVAAITAKVFFTSPAVLIEHVGTSAWYATLISAGTALIGFAFIYQLVKRFPNKNIAEIFDNSVGRTAGVAFSLIFASMFLFEASIYIREFSDVLRSYTFERTSTGLIIAAIVLAAMLAAYLGLESVARMTKLAAYFIMAGYLLLLLLGVKDYQFLNIFPLLGYGLGKTILVGMQRSSAYTEVAILGVFAVSLQGSKNLKRAGVLSLILSGLFISMGLLAEQFTFSYTSAKENAAPLFALARIIKYGDFLSRLDPLFMVLWTTATAITVSILFYASVSMFCQTFRLPDKRPVILPMTILLFALSVTPRDFSTVVFGLIEGLRGYGWTVFFGLPLIALVAAAFRKRKDGAVGA